MFSKILGYLLVLVGLTIILTTLYGSYKIFTGGIPIPELFAVPEKEASLSENKTQDLQAQMEETIKKQIGEILPVDSVPRLLNLISWSILAGILILGGGQVASIGIKLMAIKKDSQA